MTVEIEASLGSSFAVPFLAYYCFLQAAQFLVRVATVDTGDSPPGDVVFTGNPFQGLHRKSLRSSPLARKTSTGTG